MKWWEKTVEYSFVYMAAQKNIFNLLLPLDGDVESIADTVLGKDSEFFIVEFKKELSDLSGEFTKYSDGKNGYLAACKEMTKDPSSKAHFLIGGKFVEEQPHLSIEVRRYFEINETPITDITNIFNGGMNLEQLNGYTKKITALKKAGEVSGGSGSSSGSFAFESVLAVSKSNKKATLVPLYYFKAPAPKKELKKAPEYTPPSLF